MENMAILFCWAIAVGAGLVCGGLAFFGALEILGAIGTGLVKLGKWIAEKARNRGAMAWGKKFEAIAHREPGGEATLSAELPNPSAEEIKAARIIAREGDISPLVYCCADKVPSGCFPCPMRKKRHCPWIKKNDHGKAAARAWLAERGIPIEEPEAEELSE